MHRLFLLALIVFLSGSGQVHAGPILYGIGSGGTLYQIDNSSGVTELVGPEVDLFHAGGLAYSSKNDVFYSIDGVSGSLYSVSRSSGSSIFEAKIDGFPGPRGFGFPAVNGLTTGPSDQLVGTNVIFPNPDSPRANHEIFRLSPENGYVRIQGGSSGSGGFSNGITFDSTSGELFLSTEGRNIIRIDPDLNEFGELTGIQSHTSITTDFGDPPGQITLADSGLELIGIRNTETEQFLETVNIISGLVTNSVVLQSSQRIVGLEVVNTEQDPTPAQIDFELPIQTITPETPVFVNTEAGGNSFLLPNDDNPCTPPDERCFNAFHGPDRHFYSIDFDINDGEAAVVAAGDGKIVHIENGSPSDFLPVVVIDHGRGYYTEYREFQLSDSLIACEPVSSCTEGALQVKSGDPIGTLNPSTQLPSEHLHFQVSYAPDGQFFRKDRSNRETTELEGVTVGGRLLTEYKLRYESDGTPRQGDVYGPINPLLPEADEEPEKPFKFEFIAGDMGRGLGLPIFVDPVFAIGYDYQVISGPSFTSVLLPSVGDDLFSIFLYDPLVMEYVFDSVISAGVTYSFGLDGVDRFRVLGIEIGAQIDPDDPTAFVTGLTFAAPGSVRMTQTAIRQQVAVPEPSALSLLATGLGMLGVFCLRHRRKQVTTLNFRSAGNRRKLGRRANDPGMSN